MACILIESHVGRFSGEGLDGIGSPQSVCLPCGIGAAAGVFQVGSEVGQAVGLEDNHGRDASVRWRREGRGEWIDVLGLILPDAGSAVRGRCEVA